MTEWIKLDTNNNMILSTIILLTLVLNAIATTGIHVVLEKNSPLYKQGYEKGILDAKLVQSSFPASTTMSPDEVDCDSNIDPHMSNEDYCSGYQHGFSDTINELLKK
jgi:hypothetical protein